MTLVVPTNPNASLKSLYMIYVFQNYYLLSLVLCVSVIDALIIDVICNLPVIS